MIIPDVNLLLYAHIDAFAHHAAARAWWEETLTSAEVGLPAVSIFGFVRIATNRRVFSTPMAVSAAAGIVESWLGRPNVRVLAGGRSHVELALGFLTELGVAGNLTTDAQLAAAALEHRATLATNDTDLSRFAGVRLLNPLAGPAGA